MRCHWWLYASLSSSAGNLYKDLTPSIILWEIWKIHMSILHEGGDFAHVLITNNIISFLSSLSLEKDVKKLFNSNYFIITLGLYARLQAAKLGIVKVFLGVGLHTAHSR